LKTVHTGHFEIGNQDVESPFFKRFYRLSACTAGSHLEVFIFKDPADAIQYDLFVIQDQNLASLFFHVSYLYNLNGQAALHNEAA